MLFTDFLFLTSNLSTHVCFVTTLCCQVEFLSFLFTTQGLDVTCGVIFVSRTKYKVFLSHSGVQKGFVEQLNLDLKQRNRHAFFDKDHECLPIAKKFPPLIFDAIQQCEVGVVFLTDEFLSSKWPMMELVEMVRTMEGNNRMKIMPIFFGVSVEDLKDEKKLSNWKAKWQEFVESDEKNQGNKRKQIDISEWAGALTKLKPINGLVHNSMITEVQFRKKIVDEICELVRPFLAWDDSFVQGKLRFIKVNYFVGKASIIYNSIYNYMKILLELNFFIFFMLTCILLFTGF